MRALWVDSGNDPDFGKAVANGIDTFYFAMFDPRVTKAYLENLVGQGYKVGVYMASNWEQFSGANGSGIASIVTNRVRQIAGTKKPAHDFPKVQFDLEEHDPEKIALCLERWRASLPYQDTSWTMEGFQGGWMTDDFVKRVLACRVRVVPQAYIGNMEESAADMVLRDLLRRGFPENVVSLFYDAKRLPVGWDGFAFTQGRLP